MAARPTGVADAPLHGGHCPPWLFARMQRLAAAVAEVVVREMGTAELLRRLAEPVWLQAFGAVLGFDWHSSGLTTVVCGALKEGLGPRQGELGVFLAGGKGAAARRALQEIADLVERHALGVDAAALQRASRLAAKVDGAALQDGFTLYHHVLAFDRAGRWAVVQQGLDASAALARRYHWLDEAAADFTDQPHAAVAGAASRLPVLNMVAHGSAGARQASLELSRQPPEEVSQDLRRLAELEADAARVRWTSAAPQGGVRRLSLFDGPEPAAASAPTGVWLVLARQHPIPHARRLDAILQRLYERPPEDYAALLLSPGVGPATVRALAMLAEVAYGAPPALQDPVRYAFAHGGKDGHPFPVRRRLFDHSIQVLHGALEQARLGSGEQLAALRRLAAWAEAAQVRL